MHLDRLSSKLVMLATGIAVAISLVLGWSFIHLLKNEQSTHSVTRLIQAQEEKLEPFVSKDLSAQVEASVTDQTTQTLDPIKDCAETTHEQSEECKQTLDAHFLQKQPMHPGLSWITFDYALSYEEIFADPNGDRMRVFAALERPECRLEQGDVFRPDLRDTCDAQAFANYSTFLDICSGENAGSASDINQILYEYQLNHIPINRENDPLELETKLDRSKRERRLKASWLSNKCTEHKLARLELGPVRDQLRLVALIATGQIIRTGSGIRLEPSHVLSSLAHRLGAEKTVPLTHGPVFGLRNKEWTEHIQKTHAWLEPWRKLMRFRGPKRPKIEVAVDLAIALQKTGLSFDWNYLVERACLPYFQEEASCQSHLDEIAKATEWHETQKLQVLDEFETRALQLGIYD